MLTELALRWVYCLVIVTGYCGFDYWFIIWLYWWQFVFCFEVCFTCDYLLI